MKLVFVFNVLMGFLAIMNPLGNTPIFLGLVADLEEEKRREVARKAFPWPLSSWPSSPWAVTSYLGSLE